MAVIDKTPSGSLRGTNLLTLYPRWAWLGMLAPMPAFFVTGGWSNSHSSIDAIFRRLRVLAGTAAVVVTMWSVLSILEIVISHRSDVLGDGARIATQPLWFLAAYAPLVAANNIIERWCSHIVALVFTCVGVVTASDVSRFVFHAPRWVGYPGFFATWTIPWAIGLWWRSAHEQKNVHERSVGLSLALMGATTSLLLVRFAGYFPSLIDAVPGHRSNTTPPTLFTCSAAVLQVGVLMTCAHWLDVVASRWRTMLHRLNAISVGVYVWHLTALAICAGFVALGAPMPIRFSTDWWILRLPWFTMVFSITALFVGGTRFTQKSTHSNETFSPVSIRQNRLGVILISVGSTVTGLYGPRALPSAGAMIGLYVVGWILLRQKGKVLESTITEESPSTTIGVPISYRPQTMRLQENQQRVQVTNPRDATGQS